MDTTIATLGGSLARLAHGRDEAAWHELITLIGPELHRLAARLTGSAAAADDVLQEAFLQIRDHAGRFRPVSGDLDGDARRWLRRIVVHTACMHLRTERRVRRRARAGAPSATLAAPTDALVAAEEGQLVRAFLAELPAPMRDAIVLHHLEGVGFPEVARELRCPVGTAKARVHRGLERLRQRLLAAGVDRSVLAIATGLAQPAPWLARTPETLVRPLLHTARVVRAPAALGGGLAAAVAAAVAVGTLGLGMPLIVADEAPAPTAIGATAPPTPVPGIVPPATLPPGVLLAMAATDVPAAVAHAQGLITAVPGSGLVAGTLQNLLGPNQHVMLQRAIVVIGVGLPPPAAAIFTASDATAAMAALRASGKRVQAVGSEVVVAQDAAGLALGVRVAPQLAPLTRLPIDGDVRVVVALHDVATLVGPLLQLALAAPSVSTHLPPGLTPTQALARARGEVAAVLEAARDVDRLQCDLRTSPAGLTLHMTLAAVATSGLAKACQAVSPAARAALPGVCAHLGPDQGILAMRGCLPLDRLLGYGAQLLMQEHDLATLLPPHLDRLVADAYQACRGAGAAVLRCDAHDVVRSESVIAIDDAAHARSGVRALLQALLQTRAGVLLLPGHETLLQSEAVTPSDPQHGPPLQVDRLIMPTPMAGLAPLPTLFTYMDGMMFQADGDDALRRLVAGGRKPLTLDVASALGMPAADAEVTMDVPAVLAYQRSLLTTTDGVSIVNLSAIPHAHPSQTLRVRGACRVADGLGEAVLDLPSPALAALGAALGTTVHTPPHLTPVEPPIAPAPPTREF